jgi:hypothetical protein
MLKHESKIAARMPEGFMEMVAAARQVFTDLPPIPANINLEQGEWSDQAVGEWLEREHGLKMLEPKDEVYKVDEMATWQVTRTNGGIDEGWAGGVSEPDWEALVREVMAEEMGDGEDIEDAMAVETFGESAVEGGESHDVVEQRVWEDVVQGEMSR